MTDIQITAVVGLVALVLGYVIASTIMRKSIASKSKSLLDDAKKNSEQLKKIKSYKQKKSF